MIAIQTLTLGDSMHKVIVLYHPPKDPQRFRDYYVNKHLPLIADLPGLVSSYHSFDLTGPTGPPPYFCIWEGEYPDAATAGASMQSEAGGRVAADAANYADGGLVIFSFTPV
jgi:uncharacterized protein (TIGR02118 family)